MKFRFIEVTSDWIEDALWDQQDQSDWNFDSAKVPSKFMKYQPNCNEFIEIDSSLPEVHAFSWYSVWIGCFCYGLAPFNPFKTNE